MVTSTSTDALAYEWYAAYDRENEYEMNPEWTSDIRVEVEEREDDNGPFTRPFVTFYDKYDPENICIRSDTVYNLVSMR